jgi:hypothetical protein
MLYCPFALFLFAAMTVEGLCIVDSRISTTAYISFGPKLCFPGTLIYLWKNKSTIDLLEAVASESLVAWGFHRETTVLLHFIKSVKHCSSAHPFISHDLE